MKLKATLLWIAAALAAWWLAARHLQPLQAARQELLPEAAWQAQREAPPLLAFTSVALGGFQGLAADLLWLRVSRLQDQGEYFEIVPLADWITKLEPRYSEVWAFHAWNMAYNISVMFTEPEDRWRWVQHGIRLLRDEGLRYNPADPRLYHELGWIYHHKIGRHWDDAHMTYKWELARKMEAVLAGGRLDSDRIANDQVLRQRLRSDHGLDADIMLAVDQAYGPLDWRAADTHAVYWAWQGLRMAPPAGSLPNERLLYHGLGQLFRQGRITLDLERRIMLTSPDLERFSPTQAAFREALERHAGDETVLRAYRTFLADGMLMFFVYGRRKDAQAALATLREEFPAAGYGNDIEQVVLAELLAEIEAGSLRQATGMIEGFFYQSAISRILGDDQRADAMDRLARFIRERLAERFGDHDDAAIPTAERLQALAIERARGATLHFENN